MRNRIVFPVRRLLLGAVLVVAAVSTARAESITADFAGVSPNQVVSVTYNGTPIHNVLAGIFNWTNVDPNNTVLGPAFQSFCIELDRDLLAQAAFTFEPLTPRFSATVASRLQEFWGENFPKAGINAEHAASFQLGLWEIAVDGAGSLDLASGNFTVTAAPVGVASTAQTWLNAVDGQGTFEQNLIVLDSVKSQDQLTNFPQFGPIVPVPPTVVLGAMGLVSLVGYGVRRRKLAKNAAV